MDKKYYSMSFGYQITNQYGIHFMTFTIVDWVDIFSRKSYREIIMDSIKYCIKEKGLQVYGFVIMTNHVHLIIRAVNGNLSDVVRDMKKFTSVKIIETIHKEPESRREWLLHRFEWNANPNNGNKYYQVWTHENHAEEIYTEDFFNTKLNYIHMNPVRSGWVEQPEHYLYSSAKNYLNGIRDGLIIFWER